MGSLACPLCCGRLFQNKQALKNRLLTWMNNISCPVCLQKFYTTTEFAHHLDDESCQEVIPRHIGLPTLTAQSGPDSTVSTSLEETNQIDVFENTVEDVEAMGCEEDGGNLVEQWEQEENNTEEFQHFCQSCNCTIRGVREHINNFHHDEMVVLKMAEGDGDGSFLEDINQDLNIISINEQNIEFIMPDIDTLEERTNNSKIVDNSPKALVHNDSKKMQDIKNKNDESQDLHLLSKPKPKFDKVTHNASKKESPPNEQKDSKKLVTSNTISYARKIVHIEKFWEKQFWEKQAQKAILSEQEKKTRKRSKKETIKARSDNSLNSACEQQDPKQLCNAANEQDGITLGESTLVKEANANLDSPPKKPKRFMKPRASTICEVCNLKFKSNRSLLCHIKIHDPNAKKAKLYQKQFKKLLTDPPVCDICSTEFTSHSDLRIHMKMHRPKHSGKESKNLVCDVCHMVCSTEQGFRVHYQIHTRNKYTALNVDDQWPVTTPPIPLLKCKLCSADFFSNEELKAHWQSHNEEVGEENTTIVVSEETVVDEFVENEEEFFTCGKCGKLIACLLKEDHEKMHLEESRFACSICNKHFPCETDLSFHLAIHMSEAKYDCHQCKLKFLSSALLTGHMKKIHSGVKHRHACGFCGKRFAKPFEKVAHERVHTGEKPFECGVCGMRFRVKSCLRLHERIHTGVRPYSCDQCGKKFRAICNYNQHVRLHSDVRSFRCPICPKAFKTSVALAGHKAIHFKRYACPKCGRRFAVMYAMREHLNSHSSNTNLKHKCHICGATYIRKYALRDHIMTHGANAVPPAEEEIANYNYSEEVVC